MSYNDRIDAALEAINQHNEAVGGADKPGYLNPDDFISCVKASGGTSEERLSALSHEDLLACMKEGPNGVKPRVLAKEIANIFRTQQDPTKTVEKRPVTSKKAERMTARELVEAFDPEDHTNAVAVRLSEISKNEPFLVYSEGRLIDVDTTFKLLNELKSGYDGRTDIEVNGVIKKIYRIGELPENYADENPMYPGRPLRPDGTCDQTGRSWEGVSVEVRQLVRVAIDIGELKISHEIAHSTLDIVMGPTPAKTLRSRYRKAAIKFDELAKTGDLPKMKIPLGNVGGSEGTNPFAAGKQVVWGHDPALPNSYISNQSLRGMSQGFIVKQQVKWHRPGNGGTYSGNIAPRK